MRIGLQIPNFTYPDGPAALGARLTDIARTAEDAGFYSLWVMDHFFQLEMIGPADNDMLEAYSTLSFMAAATTRVKLGTLVTGVIYRHPGVLVKTVTTLDVLSGGRAYLGIGAAWFEREALGLGIPYPPTSERFERLEETLKIAHQMWRGDRTPIHGEHFQLAEPINSPPPLSKPHPPIMIGGSGEKKTLRMVAQYADACNLFTWQGPAVVAEKLEILKQHCDTVGRDYDEIEKTTLGTINVGAGGQTSAEVITSLAALADIGVQHAIFNMPDVHTLEALEIFGKEIIPAAAGL